MHRQGKQTDNAPYHGSDFLRRAGMRGKLERDVPSCFNTVDAIAGPCVTWGSSHMGVCFIIHRIEKSC